MIVTARPRPLPGGQGTRRRHRGGMARAAVGGRPPAVPRPWWGGRFSEVVEVGQLDRPVCVYGVPAAADRAESRPIAAELAELAPGRAELAPFRAGSA